GVALGRVDDQDPLLAGGLDVDVVHADPGAPDDLELAGGGQHRGRDLGRRAHTQSVVAADDRGQLGRGQAGLDVDLKTGRAEQLDGLLRHVVGDEDADRL